MVTIDCYRYIHETLFIQFVTNTLVIGGIFVIICYLLQSYYYSFVGIMVYEDNVHSYSYRDMLVSAIVLLAMYVYIAGSKRFTCIFTCICRIYQVC